ncbi:hypothetical protein JW964_09640 [candidate division KSB1 bacterium]|nr:hypothetical protein [candidate division KSB1 bacterium]
MILSAEEYAAWMKRMQLLGELEQQRQEEERNDPDGLKKFLIFLEEVHNLWLKENPDSIHDFSATQMRIERQKLLARFPRR